MTGAASTVLVVGATGSIGGPVIDRALDRGHQVRALVRAGRRLPARAGLQLVVGDLTRPDTLAPATDGIDAVVFVHGSHGGAHDAEAVDYGGVRNVLAALGRRPVRVALMTAISVTDRKGAHDWKRRAERLVRASGHGYTIVRPGWFDRNAPDQRQLHFLQGDRRQSGTPADGVVARDQIARVLVGALTSSTAAGRTLELVAETGAEQPDLDPLFAAIDADLPGAPDAVHDVANMPLDREPAAVLDDLRALAPGG